MNNGRRNRHALATVAMLLALALGSATIAHASIVTDSPTLPVLGVPYAVPAGIGCFPAAGVCADPGAFILTSVLSSQFNSLGQDIVTTAVLEATLVTPEHVPVGKVTLTGTIEQIVLGRTFSTEVGTWDTEILDLLLTGPVLGHTLTLTLDDAHQSLGTTTITPLGGGPAIAGEPGQFKIDSFFDVFVELSLDSVPPLRTTRGPVRITLVPAPASLWLLLLGGGLAFAVARRRHQAAR